MADDRVRMKSLNTFNNPLITVHLNDGEERSDEHTVIEGDEFSTSEEHAVQLEQLGHAERTKGKAEPASERAQALIGAQTTAATGISTGITAIVPAKPAVEPEA